MGYRKNPKIFLEIYLAALITVSGQIAVRQKMAMRNNPVLLSRCHWKSRRLHGSGNYTGINPSWATNFQASVYFRGIEKYYQSQRGKLLYSLGVGVRAVLGSKNPAGFVVGAVAGYAYIHHQGQKKLPDFDALEAKFKQLKKNCGSVL